MKFDNILESYYALLEADYCSGVSINSDFYWNDYKDFLKTSEHQQLTDIIQKAALEGKMKIIDSRVTKYGSDHNYGFSYLVVLGQSHIMIHTWPEKMFMNVDIFTCGNEGDPHVILNHLKDYLKPDYIEVNQNVRGIRKDVKSTSEKPDKPSDIKPTNTPQGTILAKDV